MIRIDRCICTAQPFKALLSRARQEDLAADQLLLASGAGACCGMCRPYLRRACRTGQVVFDRLLTDADEPEENAAVGG